MVRLVLFDIDGTLIRTGGAGVKAFAKVFSTEFNVPNGTDHISFAGRTDVSLVREFFIRHQIDPSETNFRRFFDNYVFWLDQVLGENQGQVLPGVHNLISRFQAQPEPPVIGLLTGNIRLGAQIKLTHFGLWQHFQTGAFGDDHEDRNQIALIAKERAQQCAQQKLRGEEILVIGDTPFDIACGKAISAKVLAVATGVCPLSQLEEHKPTWAVPDLEQVCLGELWGERSAT